MVIKISKEKTILSTASVIVVIFIVFVCINKSIVVGDWTKQTAFLWGLNCWHFQTKDAKPKLLLIDDDSGNGIFNIKQLCDELQVKATFAIIPSYMSKEIIDSLKCWQKNGFGIAIHGYDHSDWRNWTYKEVVSDIKKCEEWLQRNHFVENEIKYVVAPHASNTRFIRNAINDKGYQMITGANLMNPDTEFFQLGRLMITRDTDLGETREWLEKARGRKLFVVLGTHSSIPNEFSIKKTKAILQMAIEMGFEIQQ
jgi:peptidoglycan/xylan/chitin deacetylase (PgdA/CDA1 family)